MSLFKELVLDRIGSAKKNPGLSFIYSSKLDYYANSIVQGKMYTISGRESGGKRSFTDLNFLLGAYISWYQIPEEQRPPLKILYFNMDKPLHIKMQKWACAYLWLVYGIFIDINTLTGSKGRLYELDESIMEKIREAQAFFDYMIDEGFLKIFDGPRHPTGVHTSILETVREVGFLQREKYQKPEFFYNKGYENQITIAIIDNVEKLSGESRGGESMSSYQLQDAMVKYLGELKDIYKVTPVVIVPTVKVSGISLKKDMIPDFREFGVYFRESDIAINCFSPSTYRNPTDDWKGYKPSDFYTNPDNICRLRTVHIIRNTMGVENIVIPYVFYPENGVMVEAPRPDDPAIGTYLSDLKRFKTDLINSKNSKDE